MGRLLKLTKCFKENNMLCLRNSEHDDETYLSSVTDDP